MRLSELHQQRKSLLAEADYLLFRQPVDVEGIVFNMVDMKFELYNNAFMMMKWKGRLPDGRWLTYDRKIHDSDPDNINGNYIPLPDGDNAHYWWNWAICMNDSTITKTTTNDPISVADRDRFWGDFYERLPDQGEIVLPLMRKDQRAMNHFKARRTLGTTI